MENQVFTTLVMAHEATLTQPANLLDYLPRQARAGAKFKIWSGIIYNWAPRWQGDGITVEANPTLFKIKGSSRDLPGNDFDLEINITGPNTALIVEHKRGLRVDCTYTANGQEITYKGNVNGQEISVQQYAHGNDARFWIKYSVLTLAVHLQY